MKLLFNSKNFWLNYRPEFTSFMKLSIDLTLSTAYFRRSRLALLIVEMRSDCEANIVRG